MGRRKVNIRYGLDETLFHDMINLSNYDISLGQHAKLKIRILV